MKIVVIGGTGLIGSQVVRLLTAAGHDGVAAAPNTGVDTITGAGLTQVLTGADVVVDVSNSPSFERDAAVEFFRTSTGNLVAAEQAAGVAHHVALSVVGTGELAVESGYFAAKQVQEELIAASGVPYSIVHATQFYEFITGIINAATAGTVVRLAPVDIQPIASADVAAAVAAAAVEPPLNGIGDIAGPQRFRLDELARAVLAERQDPRTVHTDPTALYWGAHLQTDTLTPGAGATLSETRFADWQLAAANPR
ncbi:SDR family oxidoreductase [[Mycobacterium] wendilense]|uniref:SDR family oxidoreductase n=1 Tax=[Mycobacterium] wendilense TaxID=3064284 RepID=A0ABN9P4D6_9MYCO|nr:SDR family oxidoreductase [Mycolicibacterium sp. MU0050]CAJ1582100.1 SDR family oxidoreductase [Mycolicibacterium sp. MU0050]